MQGTQPALPPQPAAHPIMFWVLTGLAIAVFAPCAIMPLWLTTEQLLEQERACRASLIEIKGRLANNEARIEAMRNDPLVNERIIRRELNYRPQGEEVIRWSADASTVVGTVSVGQESPVVPEEPHVLSQWGAMVSRWLPAWPWRDLFARSPYRPLLLLMSGGLLMAAFVLYAPVSSRRP